MDDLTVTGPEPAPKTPKRPYRQTNRVNSAPKDAPKCGVPTKSSGKPCSHAAGQYTDHVGYGECWLHGGRIPTHRIAAAKAKVTGEAAKLLARLGQPEPMANPVARLLELAGEADQWLDVMREQVKELGGDLTTKDNFGAEVLRAVVREYSTAIDQVGRIAERIAKLDLEAQHIRLEKAKAAMLWHAIELGIKRAAIAPSMASDLQREIAAALREADATMLAELPPGRVGKPGGAERSQMRAHREKEAAAPVDV